MVVDTPIEQSRVHWVLAAICAFLAIFAMVQSVQSEDSVSAEYTLAAAGSDKQSGSLVNTKNLMRYDVHELNRQHRMSHYRQFCQLQATQTIANCMRLLAFER